MGRKTNSGDGGESEGERGRESMCHGHVLFNYLEKNMGACFSKKLTQQIHDNVSLTYTCMRSTISQAKTGVQFLGYTHNIFHWTHT